MAESDGIMCLYTIWDNVAEECGPIFEARNDKIALRDFRALIKKSDFHESDFTLFFIGRFDHYKNVLYIEEKCEVFDE